MSTQTWTQKGFDTTPLADSGINDRLFKLRPLIDQTYGFELICKQFCCLLFSA